MCFPGTQDPYTSKPLNPYNPNYPWTAIPPSHLSKSTSPRLHQKNLGVTDPGLPSNVPDLPSGPGESAGSSKGKGRGKNKNKGGENKGGKNKGGNKGNGRGKDGTEEEQQPLPKVKTALQEAKAVSRI